jgi:hypothetical protein
MFTAFQGPRGSGARGSKGSRASNYQKKSTVLAALSGSHDKSKKKKAADLIKDPEELQKVQDFFNKKKNNRLIAARANPPPDGLTSVAESEIEMTEDEGESHAQKNEKIAMDFFQKAAQKMFALKKTISTVLQGRIFDVMINGNETALVYAKDFF